MLHVIVLCVAVNIFSCFIVEADRHMASFACLAISVIALVQLLLRLYHCLVTTTAYYYSVPLYCQYCSVSVLGMGSCDFLTHKYCELKLS